MIGKAGLIAVVLVSATVAGRSIHPRALYDHMYPVNSLKRHAFNLCQESDPAFIRALGEDRVACYRRMPYSISLALGFVHRPGDTDLAAFFTPAGRNPDDGELLPDAGFARQPLLDSRAAYRIDPGSVPCRPAALAAAGSPAADPRQYGVLAGSRDVLDGAALAELGLSPHRGEATADAAWPPRAAPRPAARAAASHASGLTLLDTAEAADLGTAPPAPASGCAARI